MEILYFVLLGIILDRYIIPIIDIALEYISHKVNKSTLILSLDAQREQLKFNKEVESVDDPNRIGFEHPCTNQFVIEEELEEEEDDCKNKVGFKMFKQNKKNKIIKGS